MIEPGVPIVLKSGRRLPAQRIGTPGLAKVEWDADRVVVTFGRRGSGVEEFETTLEHVGHVEYLRPKYVRVRFSAGYPDDRRDITVCLTRLTAEDRFDQLIEHLEARIPDRLLSIREGSTLRYTRACTYLDLLPFLEPVTTATFRWKEGPSAAGTLRVGEREYRLEASRGFALIPLAPEDADPVLWLEKDSIFDTGGRFVGSLSRFTTSAFYVDVVGEVPHIVHSARRTVTAEGRLIGRIRGEEDAIHLEFEGAVSAALTMVLSMSFLLEGIRSDHLHPHPTRDDVEVDFVPVRCWGAARFQPPFGYSSELLFSCARFPRLRGT